MGYQFTATDAVFSQSCMFMLLNFILGSISIFFFFLCIVMYDNDNEYKTKENKNETKDKIEPQHIRRYIGLG